jgi:hypothetical protein
MPSHTPSPSLIIRILGGVFLALLSAFALSLVFFILPLPLFRKWDE